MKKLNPYSVIQRAPKQSFTRTFQDPADLPFKCSLHGDYQAMRPGDAIPACPKCKELESKGDLTENPPKFSFEIRFRKLDVLDLQAVADYSALMRERYVTGTGNPADKSYIPPMPLPPVGGQAVAISPGACNCASAIFIGQLATEADKYSFEEIVSFMTVNSICLQMAEVAGELPATNFGDNSDFLETSAQPWWSIPAEGTEEAIPTSSDSPPSADGIPTNS